jgi:hypothetical protein
MTAPRLALILISQFATQAALAQYAAAPGVRDAVVPVLVAPWLVILAGTLWGIVRRTEFYRSRVLRPIGRSVAGFAAVVAVLFAVLFSSSGLFHEKVAVVTLYTILLSGPLVLVAALGLAAVAALRQRRQRAKPP